MNTVASDQQCLADFVKYLHKYKIQDEYCTHNQHAFRAFQGKGAEGIARMSRILKTFVTYVEYEQVNGKNGTRYRWRTTEFMADHPDQFGDRKILEYSSLEQMVAACKDELKAAYREVQRNSHSGDRIESIRVGINRTLYACYLKVEMDDEPQFKEGTPCYILANKRRYGAHVVDYDVTNQCVYLSSELELHLIKTKRWSLITDASWLLQNMIDVLNNCISSPPTSSSPLLGFLEGKVQQQRVNFPASIWNGKMNQSQRDACQKSLHNNICLIWGPPGTGKSYTLSHIILSLLRVSGKTLICCISNAALDSLIKAFLKIYDAYRTLHPYSIPEGSFVRLGISRDDTVLSSKLFYPDDGKLDRFREQIKQLKVRLKTTKLTTDQLAIKDELNDLYLEVKIYNQKRIDGARVIFSTAAQYTAMSVDKSNDYAESTENFGITLRDGSFENIVLDEISMMHPPQFVALCRNVSTRIVAAGDFRQLGPIHLSTSSLALRWLKKDIFDFGRLFDRNHDIQDKPYLAQLLEQMRSHEKICKLINGVFYRGRLQSKAVPPPETDDALSTLPYKNRPVTFIDLAGKEGHGVRRSPKGSRFNKYSAQVTASIAVEAILNHTHISVGIITPYRAQVNQIKKQLMIRLGSVKEQIDRIKIGTIHAFQGDEADVIIYDIVDTLDTKIGRLYQDEVGERLLNVAISRAKRKLIVVGDIDNLHSGKGHSLISPRVLHITNAISKYRVPYEVT